MPGTIATDHTPEPSDLEPKQPPELDDALAIDVDLEEIETTTRISLDESRRLLEAAFAKPE